MRPEINDTVAEALRYPHTAIFKVEVWRDGVRLDAAIEGGLQILGGEVRDDATAKVRRSMSLELPATDEMWALLAVPGTELRPYRGIEFPGYGLPGTIPASAFDAVDNGDGTFTMASVTDNGDGTFTFGSGVDASDGTFAASTSSGAATITTGLGTGPLGTLSLGGSGTFAPIAPTPAEGARVWVPLGRLEVDQPRMGYAVSGNLSVTAGDAYGRVQTSEFLRPAVTEFGTLISTQLVTFLRQALPTVTVRLEDTSNWVIGSNVYETDRAAAIEEMLAAIGCELRFDGDGVAIIRPIPSVAPVPVWKVDTGEEGVMLTADRQGIFKDTRNVVIVTATAVDGEPAFEPVYVWDNEPSSPTYAGPDPVNNPAGAGPFGVRPTRLTSSVIGGASQAAIAGTARLAQITGRSSQLSLTAAVHPGLEAGDTIAVHLPPDPVTGARSLEAHLIESVTIPLTLDGVQQITTRTRGVVA